MSDRDVFAIFGSGLIVGWGCCLLFFLVFGPRSDFSWQLEAVRNGAATMTVDPETGRTVFQWNEQGEKE